MNSDLVATSHIELIEHDDELDLIEESHAEVYKFNFQRLQTALLFNVASTQLPANIASREHARIDRPKLCMSANGGNALGVIERKSVISGEFMADDWHWYDSIGFFKTALGYRDMTI